MLSRSRLYAKHLACGRSARCGVSKHVAKAQGGDVRVCRQRVQIQRQRGCAHVARVAELVEEQTQDVVQLILIPALVLLRG